MPHRCHARGSRHLQQQPTPRPEGACPPGVCQLLSQERCRPRAQRDHHPLLGMDPAGTRANMASMGSQAGEGSMAILTRAAVHLCMGWLSVCRQHSQIQQVQHSLNPPHLRAAVCTPSTRRPEGPATSCCTGS